MDVGGGVRVVGFWGGGGGDPMHTHHLARASLEASAPHHTQSSTTFVTTCPLLHTQPPQQAHLFSTDQSWHGSAGGSIHGGSGVHGGSSLHGGASSIGALGGGSGGPPRNAESAHGGSMYGAGGGGGSGGGAVNGTASYGAASPAYWTPSPMASPGITQDESSVTPSGVVRQYTLPRGGEFSAPASLGNVLSAAGVSGALETAAFGSGGGRADSMIAPASAAATRASGGGGGGVGDARLMLRSHSEMLERDPVSFGGSEEGARGAALGSGSGAVRVPRLSGSAPDETRLSNADS